MKTKKTDFIISHYIIIGIILFVALYIQFLLLENTNTVNYGISLIILPLVIGSLFVYKFVSKPLFENIFKSEANLDNKIKKTLHEINTPVATILLNTKMVKRTINDEKNIQRIQRIESACDDLLKLYDDMEYTIKKEIEKVDLCTFNLKNILEEILTKFDDLKDKKSISIQFNVSSYINLKTDKKGFITAISNIVSNSIKYNKQNGHIKIYTKDNTLYIEDSGIGIDTKNLFIVFDSYYQENSQNKGYGLGLSIVKEFCDFYNIPININSKENCYTIVALDIKNIMI